MNTFLHDLLPPKWRKAVYGILGTVGAIELTLDAFDAGLIPERPQGIAFAILTVLGFGMAFSNTDTAPKV
jgi:hypothetical protein